MIRTYKLKQHSNKRKELQIRNLFNSYRQSASLVAKKQWNLFYTEHRFNKDYKLNVETKLSARYLQTCQYQVVGMLESYMSNVQNRFIEIIHASTLDENTKIKLFYINKYKKYFNDEVKMQKQIIDKDIVFLARKIFHHLTKHKPTYKHINLNLDNKVAKATSKNNEEATHFDYWLKLSTLNAGNPIQIPIESNQYYESKTGITKNFVQLNLNKNNKISVSFIKDIEASNYVPLTPKIGIDIGLKILFATNNGDMFGRNFYSKLLYYDKITMKLQKELQKQNIPLKTNKKYNNLAEIKRNFVKNEVNKALNRLVKLYSPKEIVLENLYFNNPNLSKQMNRLLKTFGKRQIEAKLASLAEEFGITITKVNPAYTSQECSSCGYVEKNNRKSQSDFLCKVCLMHKNADVNAAMNVLARSSCKEISDIYISRKIILDRLIKRFIERNTCLYSKAKDVIGRNKYFPDYVQNNST